MATNGFLLVATFGFSDVATVGFSEVAMNGFFEVEMDGFRLDGTFTGCSSRSIWPQTAFSPPPCSLENRRPEGVHPAA